MSKFLEKLIKWYAKFQKSDFAKKFITFLSEVFGGENGDILDKMSSFVNNTTKSIDLFETLYKEKLENNLGTEIDILEILDQVIDENPNCLITSDDVLKLSELGTEIETIQKLSISQTIGVDNSTEILEYKLRKAETKLMIAKNVLVRHFEANKIDYTMNLLNLAIECAVARFKK